MDSNEFYKFNSTIEMNGKKFTGYSNESEQDAIDNALYIANVYLGGVEGV